MNKRTIWKFELKDGIYIQEIEMPVGAEILTAQFHNGCMSIWALVNPDSNKEKRLFAIFATGWPAEEIQGKYIATVQFPLPVSCGSTSILVFHIFEILHPASPKA